MYYIEQLYNGVSLGAIYALIAVGFSMVYGVLRLLNFAHSEVISVGAYSSYVTVGLMFKSQIVTLTDVIFLFFIAGFISGLFAVLIFLIGYRSIYEKSRVSVLISAIGISLILQNLLQINFGARSHPILANTSNIDFNLLSFVVLLICYLSIYFLLKRSTFGTWIRAVSDNRLVSDLMGIKSGYVIVVVFFIGGVLAGFSGCLIGLRDGFVNPVMGFLPGLKGFAISVVGGIGNLKGAVIIGLLLGIIEVVFQAFLPEGFTQLRDAFAFFVLLGILYFKPEGIFKNYLL
jgi:branched-chain amino acid transport system permease protein